MKNYSLIFISILAISIGSCKKSCISPLNLNTGDYFIFGSYAGECTGDCAHFYVLKNNNIYEDDDVNYLYTDSLKFKSSSLNADKYNLSKPLLDNFPSYLLDHKNEGFGCPDCSDGGAYYVILKQNGVSAFWNIDNYEQNQPAEIKNYILQLQSILAGLQ